MSSKQQTSNATINRHDQFMTINYGRYDIVMDHGQGVRLWDDTGKQYLDLFSGFGAGILGHCHPELVATITQQAGKLWHVGNLMHTDPQTRLAQAISQHGFGGRSFFCHTGADANEAAFKLARLYGTPGTPGTPESPGSPGSPESSPGSPDPSAGSSQNASKNTGETSGGELDDKKPVLASGGRYKIISTLQSFHGRSFGTMPATGQEKVRQGFEPLLEGYVHVPYNDLDAVEAAIDAQTVAVIVEPIQGEGGVNVPDANYLPGLRKLCDEYDLLLICDEVWTGCGRTGKYFAHQHWGITPDIMTLAKGVGGGLAVGVMCAHQRIAHLFDYRTTGNVVHATTLGGNCLAMAVAAKIFEIIERDNLTAHALALGEHIAKRFGALQNAGIVQIRGKGLFIGIELDITSPNTWYNNVSQIVNQCLGRGVLLNGTQNSVLRIAPPICITQTELDEGLDVLEQVLLGK